MALGKRTTKIREGVDREKLYGVAAAFAVFQFFILLIITLVTNRLAKATASYNA